MQEKDINLTVAGLYSIFLGSMTTTIGRLPKIGIALNVLGITSVALNCIFNKNNEEKFYEGLGLYVQVDNKRRYPKLKEVKETSYGKSYKFQIPDGMTTDDFIKKQTGLHERYCNKLGEIEFAYNNGFIFMQQHQNKLESIYDYTPHKTKNILEIPIGCSINGIETVNIAKSPHILIAGTTGSGKSTLIRTIITYLIQMKAQYDVKLRLMDFKYGVEFAHFANSKTVKSFSKTTDEARKILHQVNNEANRRYNLFFENECKDITEYNKKFKNEKLNHEIVIIDEFSDFYLKEDKDCILLLEELLAKLRACGIHFIISTQRPDSKVINGRIKANVPTVIGLKTKDNLNSRIIIDESGLENLRGEGHALFQFNDEIKEIQCFFIDVDTSVEYIKHTYTNKNTNFQAKDKVNSDPTNGIITDIDISKIKLMIDAK